MKKCACICLMVLLFVSVLSVCCCGSEITDYTDNLKEKISKEHVDVDNLSVSEMLKLFLRRFTDSINGKKAFILRICAIIIIVYFLSALNDAYPSSNVVKVVLTVITAVCGLFIYENVYNSAMATQQAFGNIQTFTLSFAPILAASVASSGFAEVGSSGCSALLIASELSALIAGGVMIAGVNLYSALGTASVLSENKNLKSLTVSIRNMTVVIIAFLLCVFCGIVSMQTSVSFSGDSLKKRMLKFAAGSFMPMFGGAVSESVDGTFSAFAMIKGRLGLLGVIYIVILIATPLCEILCDFLLVSVFSGVCGILGDNVLTSFLEISRDAYAVMFSLSVSVSAMLLFAINMMLRVV